MEYDECVRIIERAAEEGATELDLSSQDLHELPSEIGRLTHLKKLDLTNNSLKDLPHEAANLTDLTYLGLGFNQLAELPLVVSDLAGLMELDLGYGRFEELHSKGHSGYSLWLRRNQLTALPAEITRLGNLTSLALSGNRVPSRLV